MSPADEFLFVEKPEQLAPLVERLEAASEIGVDAEMSGMYSYRTSVCILQFSTDDLEAVVDVLALDDLSPLGRALQDPDKRCYLHGAVHDVRCLKADFEIAIQGLFDTYIAAQLLGEPKLGLSSLVADRFNDALDKEMQTVDWRKRPISAQRLEYLRNDVRYLLPLGRQLAAELHEGDLVEEAHIEFARVESQPPQPEAPDPMDWKRVKGARDLSPAGKAVLRELWLLRDRLAREHDQPPGRLLRDKLLVELVSKQPRGSQDLSRMRGFPRKIAARHAAEFLQAIEAGRKAGKPPKDPRPSSPPPTPAERKIRRTREKALKAWRKKVAADRGVPTMAVLPTYALEDLVRSPPEEGEDLAERPGIGRKRADRYGEAIRELCGATS